MVSGWCDFTHPDIFSAGLKVFQAKSKSPKSVSKTFASWFWCMTKTHRRYCWRWRFFRQVFDEKSDFFASATATPPKVVPRLQRIATSCRLAPKHIGSIAVVSCVEKNCFLGVLNHADGRLCGVLFLRTTLLDVGTGTGWETYFLRYKNPALVLTRWACWACWACWAQVPCCPFSKSLVVIFPKSQELTSLLVCWASHGNVSRMMFGCFFFSLGDWGGGMSSWLWHCFRWGFPQVKFVQEDVLHFHGGQYDRVVPFWVMKIRFWLCFLFVDLLTFVSFTLFLTFGKIARGLQCVLWESLWSCGCVEACGAGTLVRRRTCSGGTQQNPSHLYTYLLQTLPTQNFESTHFCLLKHGHFPCLETQSWTPNFEPRAFLHTFQVISHPLGRPWLRTLQEKDPRMADSLKHLEDDLSWNIETWNKMPCGWWLERFDFPNCQKPPKECKKYMMYSSSQTSKP